MGTLDRRRERIQANDERMAQAHDEFLAERSPEPTDTVRRELARSMWKHHKVELLCECGRESCSASIHVDADLHERAREEADRFMCEPTDLRTYLEQAVLPALGDFVIAEPLERPAGEPELDTMKLHLDMYERENGRLLSDVDASLSRIAGAATTGTLVFGIYAALRPNAADDLPIGWVIGALVLFVCLILTSLFGPRGIRTWLAEQTDAQRITMADLAEWRQRRMTGVPSLHITDVMDRVPAPGTSYETFDRLDAVRAVDPWNDTAFLGPKEWLAMEIRRQTRLRLAYRAADDKAETREGQALALLALLVIYIVLVTFLA
jgi:hypothetical protein